MKLIKPIVYSELTAEHVEKGVFVLDMQNDVYHAYDGISKSGLDLVNRSPAHYAYAEPRKSTRAMEIGTAIHAAILEPKLFEREYMLLRDVTDRRASEYKQAVKALGSGERVLTGSEADRVKGMQSSVRSNKEAMHYLNQDGFAELTAIVKCPTTGSILRARFDWITMDGISIDVKKTQDVRYEAFQKSIANYRYHVQDGFYSYVFELITGQPLKGFKFLAIEELAPNSSKLYELDDEAKAIGKRIALEDLETYASAEISHEWHGIVHESELISLPMWAVDEEDMGVEL
jgi:exodeoxyribonuclease VIII